VLGPWTYRRLGRPHKAGGRPLALAGQEAAKGFRLSFVADVNEMAMPGRVIVYGGKGALGSTIVSFFRSKSWVCIMSP